MPIGESLTLAARLEDMWRAMDGGAGGRSGTAKMWKMYLDGSNIRGKVKTGKDYFISSVLRDMKDPKMMTKMYPREKKLIDRMKASYKEVTGIDLDAGQPHFGKGE
jgi:hypothetical protein